MKPYGIAATLSDAVALTAAFGPGAKIGFGAKAAGSDILAPAALTLQPAEVLAAMQAGHSQYIFTFGNTEASGDPAIIGPVMDLLAARSGTGFLAACLATPWTGKTVYQGHLFQNGRLQGDAKRDLAPFIDGAIAIVPHEVINAGADAIRSQLTALKERGIRLALLDAIDDDQCITIADSVCRQPVIAGPAWISPRGPDSQTATTLPSGPVVMLSGALHRQTLMQTAIARNAMPVLDLDLTNPNLAAQVTQALDWAKPYLGETPFLISTSAPPDQVRAGFPAAQILGAIAQALFTAGCRNFLLAGNDTAATILADLGVTGLTAGPAFAGLRWLQNQNLNILIKPGSFGNKNLFLYDFEPQSRLNESAL